jgi:hypothetical protein
LEKKETKKECVYDDDVTIIMPTTQCDSYSCGNFNPLKPNDTYRGRTAPLTSKRCILYIYSTNIGTEYFKYGINSTFFPIKIAVCFIILAYLVRVLFIFYIQDVLKFKKDNNSGAKRLTKLINTRSFGLHNGVSSLQYKA